MSKIKCRKWVTYKMERYPENCKECPCFSQHPYSCMNERGMEATREIFRSIPEGASIGVMIGPEGGFSPEEIAQLDKDMHRISLGRRILRTETAGMATLSMLIYELDI